MRHVNPKKIGTYCLLLSWVNDALPAKVFTQLLTILARMYFRSIFLFNEMSSTVGQNFSWSTYLPFTYFFMWYSKSSKTFQGFTTTKNVPKYLVKNQGNKNMWLQDQFCINVSDLTWLVKINTCPNCLVRNSNRR